MKNHVTSSTDYRRLTFTHAQPAHTQPSIFICGRSPPEKLFLQTWLTLSFHLRCPLPQVWFVCRLSGCNYSPLGCYGNLVSLSGTFQTPVIMRQNNGEPLHPLATSHWNVDFSTSILYHCIVYCLRAKRASFVSQMMEYNIALVTQWSVWPS